MLQDIVQAVGGSSEPSIDLTKPNYKHLDTANENSLNLTVGFKARYIVGLSRTSSSTLYASRLFVYDIENEKEIMMYDNVKDNTTVKEITDATVTDTTITINFSASMCRKLFIYK